MIFTRYIIIKNNKFDFIIRKYISNINKIEIILLNLIILLITLIVICSILFLLISIP